MAQRRAKHRFPQPAESQVDVAATFVEVTLWDLTEPSVARFEYAVNSHAEIRQCYAISGAAHYMLIVVSKSFEDFTRIHREVITRLPQMKRIRSTLSLRSVKGF
ncbi:Lrp/AsnC ligand binding domain-containing protein [Mesorhizobium sp. NPDC059054]|uniref:Lrp/AsnC ligand binding domain-containing protein n=1 Tax=Mesorhizobium sp. NPDC059054 TaxID=3346711 RepID=UPI0036CF991E